MAAPDPSRGALVTGAGTRLGRALAEGLAADGWDVALHHHRSAVEAREAAAAIAALGGRATVLGADLSEAAEARRLVRDAAAFLGEGFRLLVHSASPWIEGPVESVTPEDWDAAFAVGPRAGFFLAQAAAPLLARSAGSIVLVSDVAARQAWPRHVPHAVAKAAIEALVRNLARALGPEVRVNGVAPGIVLPPSMDPAELERLLERTALRRLVAAEDVVAAIRFLSTTRSVTGEVLVVDAGRSV